MFLYVDVLVQVARGWGWDGGGPHWSLTREPKGEKCFMSLGNVHLGLALS